MNRNAFFLQGVGLAWSLLNIIHLAANRSSFESWYANCK
ncbi:Uncharacterised protein [Vibrio cholerae]|nr:Uncharacterised protein [Vibrio cholerae]CSB72925.1 Uncharacterised protein [Vibrio cholerae]CSC13692.1 Uncharacterised protein [Vibrio cholerae]CSC96234.1 Uncharacterised protein [Vibrio cholerae]